MHFALISATFRWKNFFNQNHKIMLTLKNYLLAGVIVLSFLACDKDDDTEPGDQATFKVTIENVTEPKAYMASGETGMLMPGETLSFSFNAGIGSYLSFATMFVQSNDLFYGFSDQGLRLYDDNGVAVTGDVTGMVNLWDAGTEVNEEPGVGPNQAPRQSGPNTGPDENGTVELIANVNDGFSYPAVADVIKVMLSHQGNTEFTVTIENVSASASLSTPLAPGVWVVHNDQVQLFTAGMTAPDGLEGVAEDGDNIDLLAALADGTGYVSPLAPGVWAVHDVNTMPLFENGQTDRGKGLEALAEDGDPSTLNSSLTGSADILSNGVFNTPVGAASPGPLLPGNSYSFTFKANESDYLSLATMLVQTNDLFYAFGANGVALFSGGNPVEGDLTSQLQLWDAGTEINEFPGAGPNQAPRQSGPDTGADENGVVMPVNDSFSYPVVNNVIKVSIEVLQ